jgi:hypothetical protein
MSNIKSTSLPDKSPAAWPPDYAAEYRRRMAMVEKIKAEPALWEKLKVVYANDPVRWIEDWCTTYDPRNSPIKSDANPFPRPRNMPFLLFPRQKEMALFLQACIEGRASGLVEKSRDMGATWLCSAFSVWLWLFHPGAAVGWGSRKESLVDRLGDPDSIFEKMRLIIYRLPGFMLPAGFNRSAHCTYMKITNPETGSAIVGESGDNIGRGGRSLIYFVDEAAWLERADSVDAALSENTDVQISISSVHGTDNLFYRRRMAGIEWSPGAVIPSNVTRVMILDWKDHPAKTQKWYDDKRAQAEREGTLASFAQEVDRDYTASKEGVIIPAAWVKAAIDAHIRLGIEASGEKVAMQDVADGGGDKNALVARHGIVCNFAKHWGGEAGEAAKIAVPLCAAMKISELYYDSIGVGTGFKVQINTMKGWPDWPKGLRVYPWNAGAKVLDPEDPSIPGDPESTKNKDQYANLKAQSWFRVRARFYKTFMAVTAGATYPSDELISISSEIECLNDLVTELSQAVLKKNGVGKTVIEKTPDGSRSPNLADGFIACYSPTRELSILDVL